MKNHHTLFFSSKSSIFRRHPIFKKMVLQLLTSWKIVCQSLTPENLLPRSRGIFFREQLVRLVYARQHQSPAQMNGHWKPEFHCRYGNRLWEASYTGCSADTTRGSKTSSSIGIVHWTTFRWHSSENWKYTAATALTLSTQKEDSVNSWQSDGVFVEECHAKIEASVSDFEWEHSRISVIAAGSNFRFSIRPIWKWDST